MIKVVKSIKTVYQPTGDFTLYTLGIEFEDGTGGLAYAKSEKPPYQSGQDVEVVITGQTSGGTDKLQIKKISAEEASHTRKQPAGSEPSQTTEGPPADYYLPSGSYIPPGERNGPRDGMLCNNATSLYIAGKGDPRECVAIAQEILGHVERWEDNLRQNLGLVQASSLPSSGQSEDVSF